MVCRLMTSQQRQSHILYSDYYNRGRFELSSGRALLVFLPCFGWSPDVVLFLYESGPLLLARLKAFGLKAHARKCGFAHTIWFDVGLAILQWRVDGI
jgi:hypothetical protein